MEQNKKRKRPRMDDDEEESIIKSGECNIYTFNNHIYFSDDINSKTAFAICKQLRIL